MSQEISKRYAQRGVSASKEDVHNAIKNIDKGLFPKAFCKIVPDYLTNDEEYCLIMHADGAGTKSSLAYMLLNTRLVAAGPKEEVFTKELLQEAYGGRLTVLSKLGDLISDTEFPLREPDFKEDQPKD